MATTATGAPTPSYGWRPRPATRHQRATRIGLRGTAGIGVRHGAVHIVLGRGRTRRDGLSPVTSGTVDDQLGWLCRTALEATGVSSCGVTMLTDGGLSVTAHASNPRAAAVEDLQHTLGEGPGVAASDSGAAVLVPDLADPQIVVNERWPTFAREAVQIGVRAAFAFPLLLGTASVGALSLYRNKSGDLTSEALAHGWVTADAVALTLAEPTETALDQLDVMRVHQAAGMVMVQLGVPIDQALVRMRGTAFAEGITVDELAEALVDRRRRLSREDS
ncbi:MAG: GAF and ANTAR domain-containing protein [Marmoricola sp.]